VGPRREPPPLAIEHGQPISDSEIAAKVGVHSKDLGSHIAIRVHSGR
jgi:hypothetical protein